MLKVLYAANNYLSSFYSLRRFLSVYGKFYNIKVAGFTPSIQSLNVNWNLDCLLDFRDKNHSISILHNDNYAFYAREINRFSPDLIISDLEVYTSLIGLNACIPVWQVSPSLLYYGVGDNREINKYFSAIINPSVRFEECMTYILNNSDKKLVLSHLGDIAQPPVLKEGYQWVRPNLQPNQSVRESCAIGYADAFYEEFQFDKPIRYDDTESIITTFYQNKYNDALNLNNVNYLSQYLKDTDIKSIRG